MARQKPTRRPVSKARPIAWRPAHSNLFSLGEGWTPPATIKVRRTVKGYTLVAEFRDNQDRPVRLTTRVAWVRGEDRLTITDEMSDETARFGAGA